MLTGVSMRCHWNHWISTY